MFKKFMPILTPPIVNWQKLPLLRISKRKKFITTVFLLTFSLLGIEFIGISWLVQAIFLLGLACYFLSAWSLGEGLEGIEWFTVLVLPVLFTLGLGFFIFFLLANWLVKISVIIFYGVGIYILLLVGNIFSVAARRTIQLLRSAHAVGFLFIIITSFFLYDVIFSFHLFFWANFFLVALVSFFLIIHGLWSINLEKRISSSLWLYTFGLSLIQGEMATVFSFWPLTLAAASLALATTLYIGLGLAQQELASRLFPKTISEYIRIGIIIFSVIFFTTRWGG